MANEKKAPAVFAFPEVSAPGTPPTAYVYLYFKADGKAYIKDDTGVETDLTASSGANTALSNLVSTAVNASIIPASDGAINLGASALVWLGAYVRNHYIDYQGSDPSNPPADKLLLWHRSDGILWAMTSGGTMFKLYDDIIVSVYQVDIGADRTTTSTSYGNVTGTSVTHQATYKDMAIQSGALLSNSGANTTSIRLTFDSNADDFTMEGECIANATASYIPVQGKWSTHTLNSPLTLQMQMKVSAGTGTMNRRQKLMYYVYERYSP